MDVFISWGGDRSKAAATALKEWLPYVLNAVEPWLSSDDIRSGMRWAQEVATILGKSNFGIICLTPMSMKSEWVLFEAGALSKTVTDTYVCPILFDLTSAQVTGPLSQFQAKPASKDGIWHIIKTMNAALGDGRIKDHLLSGLFEKFWPDLEKKLAHLPSDDEEALPERSIEDIAEETLNIVRSFGATLASFEPFISSMGSRPAIAPRLTVGRSVKEIGQLRSSLAPMIPVLIGKEAALVSVKRVTQSSENDPTRYKTRFEIGGDEFSVVTLRRNNFQDTLSEIIMALQDRTWHRPT